MDLRDLFDEAEERAVRDLLLLTEDARWQHLRSLLEREPKRRYDTLLHTAYLEIVRDILYPDVGRGQWARLGWDEVIDGKSSPAQFIHEVRLAKAAGSSTGRL